MIIRKLDPGQKVTERDVNDVNDATSESDSDEEFENEGEVRKFGLKEIL